MTGKHGTKRRLWRSDDDYFDAQSVQARSIGISSDGRRIKTTVNRICARVEDSARTDWQHCFQPSIADQQYLPQGRKRYVNSDHNIRTWVSDGRPQEYLEQLMYREGRRGLNATCTRCPPGRLGDAVYRCRDCFHSGVYCRDCFRDAHSNLPCHRGEFFNGSFFERVLPADLGVQLCVGHDDGTRCSVGSVQPHFTILDTTGIYVLDILFCRCEKSQPERTQLLRAGLFPSTSRRPRTAATFTLLEEHDHLASHGKMSPYEHYNALQQMTDAWGISIPKSKYKPWLRITRKHGYMLLMKRAGRGCEENGVATTSGGQLAILCPACPREGVNIPPNWQTLPPAERQRYMLILMMDANFRLSNIRRSSTLDPGLGTGLAYLVESSAYQEHYSKYKAQTDISTCSGFKTLEMAEKKDATGLRSTGLCMCACARHEMIRPQGVGDLQKGERYCNMDYIAMSAALRVKLDRFYSYDVACQWCINLTDRLKDIPTHLRPLPGVKLSYGVPKCHAKGHILACQCCFSMGLQLGVGNTDGEGIERVWAGINHSAASTKESLPGHRHDALDRRMATHNWEKLTRLGKRLHGSLTKAISCYEAQLADFEDFSVKISNSQLDKWEKSASDWEQGLTGDRKSTTPYWREREYVREKELINALNEEDRKSGNEAIHDINVVGFLAIGLKIENNQRDIVNLLTCEDKDASHIVDEIQNKRLTMKRMLQEFRSVQQTYMPFLATLLAARAGEREGDIETERLYLPSALPARLRDRCLDAAAAKEDRMRETQCFTALEEIRAVQRAVSQVRTFKTRNVRGTKRSGRSFDLIKRLSLKGKAAAGKYRAAHGALTNLRGQGEWMLLLRQLDDKDIRGLSSEVFADELSGIDYEDAPASAGEKRKRLGTGKGMKPADVLLGGNNFLMSWIWMVDGALETSGEDELNGVIRVEWLKCRARVARASEEMELLRDERARTLASLEYEAKEWDQRMSGWSGIDPALADGIAAYSAKQAYGRRRLADHFKAMWMVDAPAKAARVLDRIDVEEPDLTDDENEEEAAPASALQGPLPGLREQLTDSTAHVQYTLLTPQTFNSS
ncbi:hypothetical protein CYLTODRAFT_456982 [Cylindrobasidium torrendii FP15055 ss-10]|uniref:CxC2-like cysteine cluster KDZ transposase-associated domain-containing protein n=1 Tax=Cylindrobasidium torrendii FP15055 ss-10 TaxID=1314674 RepID=A0A0D7B3G9_9AGAR|nr:hypothetical protein CYLTODRAFT_456982 [Cylindrobasidium torrendii FP15055 ss-10]